MVEKDSIVLERSASQSVKVSHPGSSPSSPPIQKILPLVFSVPSAHNSDNRFHPFFDGMRWGCDCRHFRVYHTDCRHILQKRLETKAGSLFGGVTVEPLCDEIRLVRQFKRVWEAVCDGEWYTLSEIALVTGDPLQSISARLRDFRKAHFGVHQVDRRRRGDAVRGLWEYRLVPNEQVKIKIVEG